MSTCRCGCSAWHPEARTCTLPDCELRARIHDLPGYGQRESAPGPAATGIPPLVGRVSCAVGGGGYPPSSVVGGTFCQGSGDDEADRLIGGGEGAGVHRESIAA